MRTVFRLLAVVLVILALVPAAPVVAAGGDSTGRPLRVRVTAPAVTTKHIVGHVVAADETKVTIMAEGSGQTQVLPAEAVTRVEVRRKTHRKGRGALIGGLAGLAVGAVIGFAAGDDCGAPDAPSLVCIPREASALGVGIAGSLLGAGVGAVAVPGERWELVDYKSLTAGVTRPSVRGQTMGVFVSASF